MIGVGNQGASNLEKFAQEKIVALCDVDSRYLAKAKARHPNAAVYRDFRLMLARDDLDAVVVSTPDHTHAPAAVTAMRRGLHVYCEKPLAHSVHETRVMSQLAQEMDLATQMGNQHHAGAGFRGTIELVQSGAIGQVRQVHCWTNRPLWPQGIDRPEAAEPVPDHLDWDLWLGPAPERPYHRGYHPFDWRGWWDFGTGALGDLGPHTLDAVFGALDLEYPTLITPDSSPVNDETGPKWSVLRFEFPQRGGLPPVTVTWYDGGKTPPAELAHVETLPPGGALLIGEHATVYLPENGQAPVVIPKSIQEAFKRPEPFMPVSPGHHAEWVLACKTGSPTGSSFAAAARLTETCLLGNVALRVGMPVDWDSGKMESIEAPEANKFLARTYREGWRL